MRLVPLATMILLGTDLVLRTAAPTLAACGCALLGMGWITFAAYRAAMEHAADRGGTRS